MGFLERAIRRGVSDAVSKAVGNAVRQAVEPTVTDFANKTAQHFDNAAQNHTQQSSHPTSGLEGAFSNLERAAQSYATKMSENLKVCPNCNKATDAEKTYCPECGSKLPETTVAQSAVCPNCNKQNSIGTEALGDDYTYIITADHGGHDRTHGSDMPEDMIIPVIINGKGIEKGEIGKKVNIMDIAPTVTKLLGVDPDDEWEGSAIL